MRKYDTYNDKLNASIYKVIKNFFRLSYSDPAKFIFLLKVLFWQKKAAGIRSEWKKRNVHVPPVMYLSITDTCNLKCLGCFVKVRPRSTEPEMTTEELRRFLEEAQEIGISIVYIAGGEPFARNDLLKITEKFPKIIFPIFTNGLLLDKQRIDQLRKQQHVIPLLSIEGLEKETDTRRGEGVFQKVKNTICILDSKNILFGMSITVTRNNIILVTSESFIQTISNFGCKLFMFVEYISPDTTCQELTLSQEQSNYLKETINTFDASLPGKFYCFPGDEKEYGGCLGSGRGFAHINAQGQLEPCPFAPFSDTNIKQTPLIEALKSDLLQSIREVHPSLQHTSGNCTLWENRDRILQLQEESYNKRS